jgi:geranylgeranyl pyrophosphate synthase
VHATPQDGAVAVPVTVPVPEAVRLSFLRTASLLARSCRAAAILGSADPHREQCAYQYGKHMGIAYQVQHSTHHYTYPIHGLSTPGITS